MVHAKIFANSRGVHHGTVPTVSVSVDAEVERFVVRDPDLYTIAKMSEERIGVQFEISHEKRRSLTAQILQILRYVVVDHGDYWFDAGQQERVDHSVVVVDAGLVQRRLVTIR